MIKTTLQFNDILKSFKVLVLDADGVLFSGQESIGLGHTGDLLVTKTRSLIDGQGISFLRAIGIKILFASGEGEPLMSVVKKLNSLPSVVSGEWKPVSCIQNISDRAGKVPAISAWLEENGYDWNDTVYIGDDMTDFLSMQKSSLKIAPFNATRKIKDLADIVLQEEGGNGAIREFSELVLDTRGVDETSLVIS